MATGTFCLSHNFKLYNYLYKDEENISIFVLAPRTIAPRARDLNHGRHRSQDSRRAAEGRLALGCRDHDGLNSRGVGDLDPIPLDQITSELPIHQGVRITTSATVTKTAPAQMVAMIWPNWIGWPVFLNLAGRSQ